MSLTMKCVRAGIPDLWRLLDAAATNPKAIPAGPPGSDQAQVFWASGPPGWRDLLGPPGAGSREFRASLSTIIRLRRRGGIRGRVPEAGRSW